MTSTEARDYLDSHSYLSDQSSTAIDLIETENQKLKRRVKINNVVCTVFAVLYSIATVTFFVWPCASFSTLNNFEFASQLTTSLVFCILGIAFYITSITMNSSLKKYFPHFYNSFKCFLWAACVFLTIPLFLRAIIDMLKTTSTEFSKWYNDLDNFAWTNTCYLVVSTYIPIVTQMSSLIFGYLRKRQ